MTVITTGVKGDRVVSRLEIRDLLKDKDLANLYILAINRAQNTDRKELSSWFQLASIHGRPYVPFDGVGADPNSKGGNVSAGYCTHTSILFPTWHRPYLALFEQTLSEHAFEIAGKYPDAADRKRYTEAAERFRIPYWDWATDPTLPDLIAESENVDVYTPDKGHTTIPNPLYSYKFQKTNPLDSHFSDGLKKEPKWEAWGSTVRYPTGDDEGAKSRPAEMQTWLKNNILTLRNRTYNLLVTQKDSYWAFSNDGFDDQKPELYDSLEAIHGQIHGLAGSNGHMGDVDYAAFDPVFWMHHANVDRIFALWQALHPNVWIDPKENAAGTFTRGRGEFEDAKSPLTPFWASPGNFWDSDGARDTRKFNYNYPELAKWDTLSKDAKQYQIHSEVNRLYGVTSPANAAGDGIFKSLEKLAKAPATGAAAAATNTTKGKPSGLPDSQFSVSGTDSAPEWHKTATLDDDLPHYHEWIANIVVQKYALGKGFFVHIFLGEIPEDPKDWGSAKTLVGTHSVFANDIANTGCERCHSANERGVLVTGTIPLTGSLDLFLSDVNIKDLDPETVVPKLQKNLGWRVQKVDGSVVDPSEVSSLKVTVAHALVLIPQTALEFPVWTKTETNDDATARGSAGLTAA